MARFWHSETQGNWLWEQFGGGLRAESLLVRNKLEAQNLKFKICKMQIMNLPQWVIVKIKFFLFTYLTNHLLLEQHLVVSRDSITGSSWPLTMVKGDSDVFHQTLRTIPLLPSKSSFQVIGSSSSITKVHQATLHYIEEVNSFNQRLFIEFLLCARHTTENNRQPLLPWSTGGGRQQTNKIYKHRR